jgi:hypothetical protein
MKRVESSRSARLAEARRIGLLVLGVGLMLLAPFVGPIPGPGGLIVFAAGLALTLRNSAFAKRVYVRTKRRWPGLGHWSDKGLRRPSHFRRLRKAKEARQATSSGP